MELKGGCYCQSVKYEINGDVKFGESTDKLGFFGTAPVSKNTSMSSASATQVRDELIRLGIIS